MDIFGRCQSYNESQEARAAELNPNFIPVEGHDATAAQTIDGDILMCGSNNYLGLTSDPRVKAAAQAAIEEYGTSRTSSRLLNGNTPLHDELEHELADFLGMPAALVFPTGYHWKRLPMACRWSRYRWGTTNQAWPPGSSTSAWASPTRCTR
ncbi:aminotransferase class I/II-fold pyridoxal phosphate-dependent enzyme [Plantactinospora veratri]|uniref:8-amino-7-oxononanoate synthase n=1 Tax=Plantactinospora veratri TaxID=1436122 RepID=A0ABU7SEU9_9ACTN